MATYSVELRPRFRDTDMLGHVNNSVFLTYLEVARSEWFLSLDLDKRQFTFILAHVEIDFLAPIKIDSNIVVEMWVIRVGKKSWDFSYEIRDRDQDMVYAKALSVQVFYDYEENKSKALPDNIIVALERIRERQ